MIHNADETDWATQFTGKNVPLNSVPVLYSVNMETLL